MGGFVRPRRQRLGRFGALVSAHGVLDTHPEASFIQFFSHASSRKLQKAVNIIERARTVAVE